MALTVLILKISDWMMTYNRREYRQAKSVSVQNNTQHLHWVISCRAHSTGNVWVVNGKRKANVKRNISQMDCLGGVCLCVWWFCMHSWTVAEGTD